MELGCRCYMTVGGKKNNKKKDSKMNKALLLKIKKIKAALGIFV